MPFKPKEPRLAASIVLLQGQKPNIEAFMIKRNKKLRFLGGYHAFPGGKLEEDDFNINLKDRFKEFFSKEDNKFFEKEDKNLNIDKIHALYVAALRELFEEIGILLAYDESNILINNNDTKFSNIFIESRKKLLNKEIEFSEIINNNNLILALEKIQPFKHFVTPEFSPIRYDTYFFMAILPNSQEILETSQEVEKHEWIKPIEAIKKYFNEEIKMIPPQLACLSDVKKLNKDENE